MVKPRYTSWLLHYHPIANNNNQVQASGFLTIKDHNLLLLTKALFY